MQGPKDWSRECPVSVVDDTGWTLGAIAVPPELHEYMTSVSGGVYSGQIIEQRLVKVQWNSGVNCSFIGGVDHYNATRYTPRTDYVASCPIHANPVRFQSGEKLEEVNLSQDLGFPLHLNYSSYFRPSQFVGNGSWSHDYSGVLVFDRVNNSVPTKAVVYDGNYFGRASAYFEWDPVSNIWQNKSNSDDRLIPLSDGSWMVRFAAKNAYAIFSGDGYLIRRGDFVGNYYDISYESVAKTINIIGTSAPPYLYSMNRSKTVTDKFGRRLDFAYEANQGFLSSVSAGGATIHFDVGSNFDKKMNWITFNDGNKRTFVYGWAGDAHALTGIVDELNQSYASFVYDADGRVKSLSHGSNGDYAWSFNYDGMPWTVKETDPLLSVRTYVSETIDVKGVSTVRLLRQDQPAGSGCAASSSALSYDANGNLASADDFNGNRTCYSNDLTRHLAVVQVDGLAKTVTCSSVTTAATSLPAGSRKTSTQWHPDWALETKQAKPGSIVTWVYNGQPDPFNANQVASCVKDLVGGAATTALLPDGKPIAVLCKRVEQGTADKNGSQGFSAVLDNTKREENWTYTQYGQILTYDGPRTDVSDVTRYAYYTADDTATPIKYRKGDLKSVTDPLGKVTTYNQYNLSGRPLQMTDPNNVITQYTYDLRQRLKTVAVQVSGTTYDTTTLNYWPTGQLKQVLFPDSSTINYDYDDAHRLTAVYDNVGNRINYVLDAAGNVKNAETRESWTTTNVLRTKMSQVMDALGRVQQTTGGLR